MSVPFLYVETDKTSFDGLDKSVDDNTVLVTVGLVNLGKTYESIRSFSIDIDCFETSKIILDYLQ